MIVRTTAGCGIKRFEPISLGDTQVDVLHAGHNDPAGYFYYIMELADDASEDDLCPRDSTLRVISRRP
jgi:hypothetical protein